MKRCECWADWCYCDVARSLALRVIAALLLLLALTSTVTAQPQPQPDPPAADSAPAVAPTVTLDPTLKAEALEAGDKAPFDGVLLEEKLMIHYLKMDISLHEANGRVAARDKTIKDLEGQLAESFQRKIDQNWWERHDGKIGLAVGIVAGALATVWAVDKLK